MTNLLDMCRDLPLVPVASGEVLIEQGSAPSRMFVLATGEVTVERDGVAVARVDVPGAVFGEMSVVLDRPATATARAATDVEVRVVDDPLTFFVERPGAALVVLRTTASRLDGMTQYLTDVKQQLAGEDGHLGMVGSILDTLVHHQGPAARPGSARDPDG